MIKNQNRLNYLNFCRKGQGEDADRNIQIIWYYKDIDGLVMIKNQID